MSVDFSDKNSKSANSSAGQGFGSTKTPAGSQSKAAPVADAQAFALSFATATEANLSSQLQRKAENLSGVTTMVDSAVDAIVQIEEDILSGNYLERKLAERRSQYAFGCVEDAKVSFEFEALNTLEVLAKPASFPSIADTIKAISPAQRKQLDAAVLGGN